MGCGHYRTRTDQLDDVECHLRLVDLNVELIGSRLTSIANKVDDLKEEARPR